jgi:ABC-type dipeptide/oligopeptide/nickel transport system permease component
MKRYVAARLLQSFVVLLGVSAIAFLLMYLTGDPVPLLLPADATVERIAEFRRVMGFDRPVWVQYGLFLSRALRGDLGRSVWFNQPVLPIVLSRVPKTAQVAVGALALGCLIAFPLGIAAALRARSWWAPALMAGAIVGYSTPTFWLGLLLILTFSVGFGWLPASGSGSALHLIMPVVTLGTNVGALLVRLVWSGLLEVLGQDYVRTARSKGVAERLVLWRHALKNALLPVITVIGLELAGLLGGAVVTETVFAWPGMGRLTVESIYNRDYPMVQGLVLVMAVIFVVANLIVDVSYAALDPRVRYE